MVRKIIHMKLTDQGIKDIKNAPHRIGQAITTFQNMGGKMLCIYATEGKYDYVAVGEAPSEEIAMAFVMSLNAMGNVRTTTANAFTKEEFASMVNKCYECFQDAIDNRPLG